jgi:protein-tyrosine kinase
MDRIRKALDLARIERQQQSQDAPRTLDSLAPGPIVYTSTRVVPVSPEHLETRRVVSPGAPGPASAGLRMLRTQVLQRMAAHRWRTLAIFSPSAGEGRTTTAVNLALHIANDQDHTVLLVDLDLRRPSVAAAFGFAPERGVEDVLTGGSEVRDCLYHPDGCDRLVVLPARAPVGNSSELLAGQRCRELVAELRSRYEERIVLFDLPSVLTNDDALAFSRHVECGLVVAAEGRTRRTDLTRAIELLRETPIVGTLLNRASGVATER